MEELGGRTSRFGFLVTAEAMVTVEGANARGARDLLCGVLDGATAAVTVGNGTVLELVDIRLSDDVVLVLIDGADPIESLRTALTDWRRRGGVGDG